jgi:hypothetical protein
MTGSLWLLSLSITSSGGAKAVFHGDNGFLSQIEGKRKKLQKIEHDILALQQGSLLLTLLADETHKLPTRQDSSSETFTSPYLSERPSLREAER